MLHFLDDMGLHYLRDYEASNLSRGDKRRLEITMCLIQHPRLLLLDEPTAGMARHDTNRTIDLLKRIKERGMTKVIIEHDMHVVFSLADWISVLAQGAIIAEGTPDDIKGNPKGPGSLSGRCRGLTVVAPPRLRAEKDRPRAGRHRRRPAPRASQRKDTEP